MFRVSRIQTKRLLLVLLLALVGRSAWAKGPEPALKIPLDPLGFQSPPPKYLAAGGTMFTVHFVDQTHVLLTYNTRVLLKRKVDDTPDDEARVVTALLLELPTGRIVARTQWRTPDHEQYLWPLTHGRFLLRIRNSLRIIAPLAHLASGDHADAFEEQTYFESKRRIALISLSPDARLLTIETMPPPDPKVEGVMADVAPSEVQINFYRLASDTSAEDPKFPQAIPAGAVRSDGLALLPLTPQGSLSVAPDPEQDTGYMFDFNGYAGGKKELAAVESSCRPRPIFVSNSEFIAFTCRGAEDKLSLGGFNMKGEQMWIQDLAGGPRTMYFPVAPAAGRFAVSRMIMSSPASPDIQFLAPAEVSGQEIAVIQTWSGQELLKLQIAPAQRAGQNFDLSADGSSLAVLRAGNLEIYRLPVLSEKDKAAIAEARSLVPKEPVGDAVKLTRAATLPEQKPAFEVPAGATVDSSANAPGTVSGDLEPTEKRKPPTLYDPGEKHEKP